MPGKFTQKEFEDKFNSIHGDEFSVVGSYVRWNVPIDIRHNVCGTIFPRIPNNLTSRKTCCCPVCDCKKVTSTVTVGVDDIHTTSPELFNLLKNKDDGYKYTNYSTKEVWFVCPICGKEHFKKIRYVYKNGLCCECNSLKISYPEKIMIDLLNQLDEPYKFQFSPKWIYPYKYDFYLYNRNLVIEMDGGLGHGKGSFNGENTEDLLARDNYKDNIALNYKIKVVRIDCDYKDISHRFEFIKNSILNSELSKILNLSKVNFNKCHEFAVKNLVQYLADLWNSGIAGYDNLKQYIPVSRSTLRAQLKEASDIGLIKESYQGILKKNRPYSNKKLQSSKGIKVLCNETGEIFPSIAEAGRKYSKDLSRFLSGKSNDKYCGKLPDGTKLTWQIID